MTILTKKNKNKSKVNDSSALNRQIRPFMTAATFSLFALLILMIFLSPFAYMVVTSFKTKETLSEPNAPLWPAKENTFNYEGEDLEVYLVPTDDGETHKWAILKQGREESTFIDINNPEAGPFNWTGKWRTLERDWIFTLNWGNFTRAWKELRMPLLLRNTVIIAGMGSLGTVISCVMVGYGFSRFRIPGKNAFFTILIGTIILPSFVTLVPTYTIFYRLGWVGTWLPLIVPHFFANAYNVFLLRQFFMTIPKELDEAAMIDGAGPLRTLISIILPQSLPVIVAVGIGHFLWSWNDYFTPLIYLLSERDLQPIALGIQGYNSLYGTEPQLIQASSLLGLLLPVIVFFFVQRFFIRGIVFTGVEK
ncbi:MAG: carbohydrate ABC transporter permease [Anaerolineaceae bacterium]|nr:carbohydrate ABC transporter permease [Anaerolineaceae bacterium]